MSLEHTNIVDFVAINPTSGKVELTLLDPLPWTTDDQDHLFKLQEKLNSYLGFVESGEVFDSYPKARDREISISIVFKYEPTLKAREFLEKAQAAIAEAGMELLHEVFAEQ